MKRIILLFLGILILSIYTGFVSCDKKKPTQSSQDCPLTCKRGDINYNTIPYEVTDVVLFAHYFIDGINIFSSDSTWRDFQICTSDVNSDCKVLTLSDLVYFVRIILHDAVMIKSTEPSSEMIFFIVRNNIITVCSSCSIGAVRFEFDTLVTPTLLSTNMEMMSKDNKILIWSRIGNCIAKRSEVISFIGNARLKKVEVVDCDSREYKDFIVIQLK
jgi:hypothetical protein